MKHPETKNEHNKNTHSRIDKPEASHTDANPASDWDVSKLNEESLSTGEQEKSGKSSQEKTVTLKESEYKKLLQEISSYKDKYVRLAAEFDNARKRMEREKAEFVKYAHEGLIVEFLSILDDLERSVEAAKAQHEDYTAFLKGIELVMAHVYEMLRKSHVKPIEAVGKMFDPHCHEALMQVESEDAKEGAVLEEFQKGYLLGERVIRTAKVKVATAKNAKK
jgi:molecular chaperone GrpE